MRRWGIGVKWALGCLAYGAVTVVLNVSCFPWLRVTAMPQHMAVIIGVVTIAAGLAVYAMALVQLHTALAEGTLVTEGVYAYVRHPIYASFIVLIVPGIVLIARSLLGLSVPVFMYVLFTLLVRQEDEHLEEQFGEEYLAYRRRVNPVFPKLFRDGGAGDG